MDEEAEAFEAAVPEAAEALEAADLEAVEDAAVEAVGIVSVDDEPAVLPQPAIPAVITAASAIAAAFFIPELNFIIFILRFVVHIFLYDASLAKSSFAIYHTNVKTM